jgi:hypothetical protein
MLDKGNRPSASNLPTSDWRKAFRNIPIPQTGSRLISVDSLGSRHDHDRCPAEFGRLETVSHIATPINPIGTGRKVNIGGEGETAYLGFDDFVTETQMFAGPLDRPLTCALPNNCASDICLRSAPVTSFTEREICRIARDGCRLTIASNHETMIGVTQFMMSIGKMLEYDLLTDETQPDKLIWAVLVLEIVSVRAKLFLEWANK